jgi:adenylosuccinate lyase
MVQRNAMESWSKKIHLRDLVLQDEEILQHVTPEEIAGLFSFENILGKLRASVDTIFERNGL